MKRTLRDNVEYLGLDYKKEMAKNLAIVGVAIILTVLSFIFVNQIYISIFVAFGTLFLTYVLFSSYSSKRVKMLKKHVNEFVSVISYFETFISNNYNVYHSLESIIPFASPWMANELNNLIQDIDRDKSIKPFVDFARVFESSTVENVMISIYQMVDEGENNQRLTSFTHTFEELSKINKEELIESYTKSLESMNLYPLLGAGLIAVMLTYGIVTVIGEMVSVI